MKTSTIYKVIGSALLVAGLASTTQAAQYWEDSNPPPAVPFPTPNYDIANNPISDVFSGRANLSRTCFFVPITLGCTLELEGTITEVGTDIKLDITDGSSLGPTDGGAGLITCNDISFNNFASGWVATTPQSNLPTDALDTTPVEFDVTGVVVDTICGSCSGTITAEYRNVGRGEFNFSGSIGACSVSGILDSEPTANSTAGSGKYYRVWQ